MATYFQSSRIYFRVKDKERKKNFETEFERQTKNGINK